MYLRNSFQNSKTNKSVKSDSFKLSRPTSSKSNKSEQENIEDMWKDLSGNASEPRLATQPHQPLNDSIAISSATDLKEVETLSTMSLNPFKIKVTASRPTTSEQNRSVNHNKENMYKAEKDFMNATSESFTSEISFKSADDIVNEIEQDQDMNKSKGIKSKITDMIKNDIKGLDIKLDSMNDNELSRILKKNNISKANANDSMNKTNFSNFSLNEKMNESDQINTSVDQHLKNEILGLAEFDDNEMDNILKSKTSQSNKHNNIPSKPSFADKPKQSRVPSAKVSLNIEEDAFMTNINDGGLMTEVVEDKKVTSKSTLKDILNCDDDEVDTKEERQKIAQIKNQQLKMLELEEKLNELRKKEREVMNQNLDTLVQQKVDKSALYNIRSKYHDYEETEKDKSFLDDMEKQSENIKSKGILSKVQGLVQEGVDQGVYESKDMVLDRSYEDSEENLNIYDSRDIEEDEDIQDTSRVQGQLEFNRYDDDKITGDVNDQDLQQKVSGQNQHHKEKKDFIAENISNLKKWRKMKALNQEDEKRFQEILEDIDQEKEILGGINSMEALMEQLARPIARNKQIRDFINSKIQKLRKENKKDTHSDQASIRSTGTKISEVTNMSNYSSYSKLDYDRINEIDSKLGKYNRAIKYQPTEAIEEENYDSDEDNFNFVSKKDIKTANKDDKQRDKQIIELENDRKFKKRMYEIDSNLTALKYQHQDELKPEEKETQLKGLLDEAYRESKSSNNYKHEEQKQLQGNVLQLLDVHLLRNASKHTIQTLERGSQEQNEDRQLEIAQDRQLLSIEGSTNPSIKNEKTLAILAEFKIKEQEIEALQYEHSKLEFEADQANTDKRLKEQEESTLALIEQIDRVNALNPLEKLEEISKLAMLVEDDEALTKEKELLSLPLNEAEDECMNWNINDVLNQEEIDAIEDEGEQTYDENDEDMEGENENSKVEPQIQVHEQEESSVDNNEINKQKDFMVNSVMPEKKQKINDTRTNKNYSYDDQNIILQSVLKYKKTQVTENQPSNENVENKTLPEEKEEEISIDFDYQKRSIDEIKKAKDEMVSQEGLRAEALRELNHGQDWDVVLAQIEEPETDGDLLETIDEVNDLVDNFELDKEDHDNDDRKI